MKIGVIAIATRKYKFFVNQFLQSVDKHFMNNDDVTIFLFVDNKEDIVTTNKNLKVVTIDAHQYPFATLLRYREINNHKDLFIGMEYLFYIDISMQIVSDINHEIINENNLTAVAHSAFWKNKCGIGTYEKNTNSLAYFDIKNKKYTYVQGSFQGGVIDKYLKAVETMSNRIDKDLENNIIALWHDETHWNKYVNEMEDSLLVVSPAYSHCYRFLPDSIKPIILKLEKNGPEMRKV